MKILLISPAPPPTGGDAIWTKHFLLFLKSKSVDVKLINTSMIGIRAVTLGSRFVLRDEMRRAYRIWTVTLLSLLRFRPDVVHLTSNCARKGVFRDFITIILSRLSGAPVVMHCHSNPRVSIGSSIISIMLLRWCFNLVDYVIVLNENSESFVKSLGETGCHRIPNFVGEEQVAEYKAIRKTVANVLFVGHLIRTKGIFEFFSLAGNFPKVKFTVAGALTNDVINVVVPPNVILLGDVEHSKVRSLLDEADVFILPTYSEGFSIAILEAMARGLPIITTPVGANEEMIGKEGGSLVEVGDVTGLCAALDSLKCPALRSSMSRYNLQKVKDNYVTNIVGMQLLSLYESLLSGRRAKRG